jgi:hypothetical protein
MKQTGKILLLFIIMLGISIFLVHTPASSWGFYSHKKINRMAVFTLPPQMIGFYKKHIEYITEHATDPDRRCFADEKEAPKHYLNIDCYGDKPFDVMPKLWKDAVAKYTEDTLKAHGTNPWAVLSMEYRLTDAFKKLDVDDILFTSANLGHYIGDACTPLHMTKNYNGKRPEQKGIHSFWETRVPELLAEDFDFFVGRAEYIEKPVDKVWTTVKESYDATDTIFAVYDKMLKEFTADQIYSYENKGNTQVKVYSKEFTIEFNKQLNDMAEKRMRTAILLVGSMWYTAWVNAGQPDLSTIEDKDISDAHKKEIQEQEKMWKTGKVKVQQDPD